MDSIGPLQLVVIDFVSAVLPPLVHAQIDDLRRRGLIRLADSVAIAKSDSGKLIMLDSLDAPRGDSIWCGVLARSLFGADARSRCEFVSIANPTSSVRSAPELGVTEEQLLEIADLIPAGSHALVLLIEHLWTAELDMAAMEANGHVLANCWISPALLEEVIWSGRSLFK